jgi:hypothetical protein
MIILYSSILLVLFIGIIYYGVALSENIKHPTLIALFWIVYLSTLLTVGNIVATGFFYNTLREKKGLPGDQGRIGDKGEFGTAGKCGVKCDGKACIAYLSDNINAEYQKAIKAINPKLPLNKIKNLMIVNNIKITCNSFPYQEIIKYKPMNVLNDYIVGIYSNWIKLLINTDESNNKEVVRNYLENEDADEPKLKDNVIKEIENYDVFYWGADRIFHPRIIEICNDPRKNRVMPQNKRPKLKGFKTNMYDIIRNNDWMRRNDNPITPGYRKRTANFSIGRAKNFTFEGVTYYPIGDTLRNIGGLPSNGKYLETFKTVEIKKIEIPVSLNQVGFDVHNLIIAGTEDYVRPPLEWEPIWKSRKRYNLSFWRPKDIYDDKLKKWFRALGFMAVNSLWSNPRQIYGWNTPENQPIRLVSEDLLEDLTTTQLNKVWDDSRSGSDWDVSVYYPNNPKYMEEICLPNAWSSLNQAASMRFYRIKDSSFREQVMNPLKSNNPLISDDGLGVGYHGTPERDPKYSIFSFINLPVEVQITNIGLGSKVFLAHSGLNIVNSYMIRQLSVGETELKGAFGKSADPNEFEVYDTYSFNPNNPNLIWEIICVDENNNNISDCSLERYLIKKRDTDLHLKSYIHQNDLDAVRYKLEKLPFDNGNAERKSKAFESFVWYNPKSATGNQLIIQRPIRPVMSAK